MIRIFFNYSLLSKGAVAGVVLVQFYPLTLRIRPELSPAISAARIIPRILAAIRQGALLRILNQSLLLREVRPTRNSI